MQNKNDFLRKVINYFLNAMAGKILLMRLYIWTKKRPICMLVLCQCVMENCKGKISSIGKNCFGCKINILSICKSYVLSWNVAKKAKAVNLLKQKNANDK